MQGGVQSSSKAQGKRAVRGWGAGGKAPMARPMTRSLSLGEIVEHPLEHRRLDEEHPE